MMIRFVSAESHGRQQITGICSSWFFPCLRFASSLQGLYTALDKALQEVGFTPQTSMPSPNTINIYQCHLQTSSTPVVALSGTVSHVISSPPERKAQPLIPLPATAPLYHHASMPMKKQGSRNASTGLGLIQNDILAWHYHNM